MGEVSPAVLAHLRLGREKPRVSIAWADVGPCKVPAIVLEHFMVIRARAVLFLT